MSLIMSLCDALDSGNFVVTAQMHLPQTADSGEIAQQAEILGKHVDAVQLTDNPGAKVHMSGLAAAALLIPMGLDPVVHFNCRDRNRIALQGDLLGAVAIGVTSILVSRGREIPGAEKFRIKNVFDTPAKDLMAYVRKLRQEESNFVSSDFRVGATSVVFNPESDWTPQSLSEKCDAGANFVQSQLCFDLDILRNYMARIVAARLTHRSKFLIALSPLPSVEVACWMRENIKGAVIPDSILNRMYAATDPEREGIEICAELMREASKIPGIAGVNLLTLGSLSAIPEAIALSGLRSA